MSVTLMQDEISRARQALIERHRALYDAPEVDASLARIVRDGPHSKLSEWDVHRMLRLSRSVFFDTHVEVVSGHHTGTYLRFESIARVPQLVTLIARDMADWLRKTFEQEPVAGLVAPASDAQVLAERLIALLRPETPLRLVLTPFNRDTGRIGTDIPPGAIRPGERFVAFNDVTTRGNCVSKLGKVVTDHGGVLAGMMVFARRDSGQFPLMADLTARYPFYYTADLAMPQWEADRCPLCHGKLPLLSWKEMPDLA
jgi:orotate phosphoribosyltransferase